MEDIAAEAGVSKPILYRHFQDKGDLYMAVSERATEQLRSILLDSIDPALEPAELLRVMIDGYLRFIEDEPDLYRFVVRRSFPDRPVQEDPVTTNAELIARALAAVFTDWLRARDMDPRGAETWAHAGVGMVQAAGDWWLQHRALSREELRDYLLMMAWGALDTILRAGGVPDRMSVPAGATGRDADVAGQLTEKPTRGRSDGPIST